MTIPILSSFCKWLYNRRPVGLNQRNKFIHALKIISELLHASSPTIPITDNYCNSCATGNPMSLQTTLQLSAQFSGKKILYEMWQDPTIWYVVPTQGWLFSTAATIESTIIHGDIIKSLITDIFSQVQVSYTWSQNEY